MYRITPSETARNQVDRLADHRRSQLSDILDHLAIVLPALRRAGLVRRSSWFGRDVDIYFDDVFPYAILFEEFVDQQELYIHVVLPMLARRDRGR